MSKCYVKFPSVKEIKAEAPGIIVGAWQGKKQIILEKEGVSNITNQDPMEFDMHFRIGSLTKTFTGTVVLKLQEQAYLNIKDFAYNYIDQNYPWYDKFPKNITIEQLGNMTSGLFNYSEDTNLQNQLDSNPERKYTPVELVAIALNNKPYFKPGQGWYYTNTNFVLLGLIAEHASKKTMKELYREIIFEPLCLKNSCVGDGPEIPEPYSQGYMYGYNNSETNPQNVLRNVTHDNPSWANTAGYMISTLYDLKRYVKAFARGTLIGKEMTYVRSKTFISAGNDREYGFGIGKLYKDWYGHGGAIPGYQTSMYYNDILGITVLILANLQFDDTGVEPATNISNEIISLIEECVKADCK